METKQTVILVCRCETLQAPYLRDRYLHLKQHFCSKLSIFFHIRTGQISNNRVPNCELCQCLVQEK